MPLHTIQLPATLSARELEDEIFRVEQVRIIIRARHADNTDKPWNKTPDIDNPRFMSYSKRFKEPARAKSKATLGRLRERVLSIMKGSGKGYVYQFAIVTPDGHSLPGILSSHERLPYSHGSALDLIRFR